MNNRFDIKDSIRSRNEKVYAFVLIFPIVFLLYPQPLDPEISYPGPVTQQEEDAFRNSR